MFKDIRFLVHPSVQAADDVAITIQNHSGLIVLTLAGADVVLVDKDRCASIPVAAHAEVVQYTWVDSCLKHGLRLPYTYSADPQVHARTIDSSPAASMNEGTPHTNRSTTSPTIACTEDVAGHGSRFEHGPPSRDTRPGILPIPGPSILRFRAGGGKIHPPELKGYLEIFLTAIWTLEPSRQLHTVVQDLLRILPNLSVWSLSSFAKRQEQRVHDARTNGLAAHRSGVSAGATVEGEIKKLLDTLRSTNTVRTSGETAVPRRSANAHPQDSEINHDQARTQPQTTSSPVKWGHQRLGLDARIGSTTVQALLSARDLPALPIDQSVETRYAFYDAVLQWVLEREPTASRFPINSFVFELGGRKMFTERSFESSYKTPARIVRYKQIRQGVLDRWRSGELGTLSKDDEAVIAYIDHAYGRPRLGAGQRPLTARVGPGGSTTRSASRLARDNLSGIAAAASTGDPPAVLLPTRGPEDATVYWASHAGAADAVSAESSDASGYSEDETEDGGNACDGDDVLMFDEGGTVLKDDDDDESEDGDIARPNSAPATTQAPTPQETPAPTVFPDADEEKALYDLVQSFRWFEDYCATHKLNAEARAAKRAVIWQHMTLKFKRGTDQYWKEFYEANQAEIETRVQASRVRPTGSRGSYWNRV